MRVIEGSLAVLDYRSKVILFPALGECGLPPKKPAESPKPAEGASPAQQIVPPAGMTATQFGVLRERVDVYLLTRGKDDPFTPAERSALDARMSDLSAFTPLLREGTLEWSSWGDLGAAWKHASAPR